MEIRNYAHLAWRRLWLIAALPALVLAFSLVRPAPKPQGYVASMRFSVGLVPEAPSSSFFSYDRYYTWLTAEYLTDDLAEIVRSQEIAQAASAEALRQGLTVQVPAGAIQGSTSAGKLHRILTVSLNWGDPDQLQVLANALATVLDKGQTPYFEQFRASGTPVSVHLIDQPTISPIGASLRSRLDLPLRLTLGLIAGVGLAFFVEYLDDSVHGVRDLRATGLDVLGSIPRRRRRPWADRDEQWR